MTYDEKRSLYESIMKTLAVEVKRQINEMSPDVYRKAAQKRANHGNTKNCASMPIFNGRQVKKCHQKECI